MPRHADVVLADQPPRSRRGRVAGITTSVLLVTLLVAAVTPTVFPQVLPDLRSRLPWFPAAAACPTTVVEVVTAPTVQSVIATVAAPLQNRLMSDGHCLQVLIRTQDPSETLASSTVLPASRAPQIWVSDSSLTTSRLRAWKSQRVGSLGTSPIVLMSSVTAVTALGWAATAPSWRQALDGTHRLSSPDLATSADAQLAMLALWQASGKGQNAERAVAAAVLNAGRTRTATGESAVQVALKNDPAAPLIIGDELSMVQQNQNSITPSLAAVYPTEGSPLLDFPVMHVSPEQQDASHALATAAVITAITGPPGRAAAHAAGLRDAKAAGGPTGANGVTKGRVKPFAPPPTTEVVGFFTRLASLAVPSRILAVIDVSTSMRTMVKGTGLTRIQLAAKAAMTAGELLTDTSSVGLWVFAVNLTGDRPYREITKVAALGSDDGTTTHRSVLNAELTRLDNQVAPGGTGLFQTTLAAIRAQRASFDPRTVNTVVLFTDGTNENDTRISLNQLIETLKADAAAAPTRPVRLVAIGMGPTADMAALQAMAVSTAGGAFRAETPAQLQQVLFAALAQRH